MQSPSLSAGARLIGRPGVQQFIKFCLVGASSTLVDVGIYSALTHGFSLWWVMAKVISFTLGVTNGFIWNSRWTFNHFENADPRKRYIKFVAVNIVGLLLSLTIMKTIFVLHYGSWQHDNPKGLIAIFAMLTATPIVVFWNFFANKHWTFKD